MPRIFQLTIIAILVLSGCTSRDLVHETYSCNDEKGGDFGIQISSRSYCGWGASTDSLTITGKHVTYYCSENSEEISYELSCDDVNGLLGGFDLSEFNKLSVHTCNICVDGCDYSIAIKTDNSFNKIVIGGGSDVPQFENFYEKLNDIRKKLYEGHCSK